MRAIPRLLPLLLLAPMLVGCQSDSPPVDGTISPDKPVAVESDLSLSVSSGVFAGEKLNGFAGSSHPPVIVRVMTEAGDDLPTMGLGTGDERSTSFTATVPAAYRFDVVVVTARDGTGAKITKRVSVVR